MLLGCRLGTKAIRYQYEHLCIKSSTDLTNGSSFVTKMLQFLIWHIWLLKWKLGSSKMLCVLCIVLGSIQLKATYTMIFVGLISGFLQTKTLGQAYYLSIFSTSRGIFSGAKRASWLLFRTLLSLRSTLWPSAITLVNLLFGEKMSDDLFYSKWLYCLDL